MKAKWYQLFKPQRVGHYHVFWNYIVALDGTDYEIDIVFDIQVYSKGNKMTAQVQAKELVGHSFLENRNVKRREELRGMLEENWELIHQLDKLRHIHRYGTLKLVVLMPVAQGIALGQYEKLNKVIEANSL